MAKFYKWIGSAQVRDDYQKLHDSFKHQNVLLEYWHSFVPPDRIVWSFSGLTLTGVHNVTARYQAMNLSGFSYRVEEASV